MRRLLLVAALPLLATSALAKGGQVGPLLLDNAKLDPALVLAAPPAPDSAEAQEELAQLRGIDATRTQAMLDEVKREDAAKDGTIFRSAIGPTFDLTKLPATAAMLAVVRREEKAAADRGKGYFRRNRPWIVDKGLHPCGGGDDEP